MKAVMATTMTKDPIAIGSQQNGVISAIKKTNRLTICEPAVPREYIARGRAEAQSR